MKHLKIFLSILFFSFLGSIQNQLLAQDEPTKSVGASTQTLNVDEYLENGDFRAKLTQAGNRINMVIYKASDNSVVRTVGVSYPKNGSPVKFFGFDTQDQNDIKFYADPSANDLKQSLTIDSRNRGNLAAFKILNTSVEVTDSAFLKLESDGRLVIYSGIGGTPLIELVHPW